MAHEISVPSGTEWRETAHHDVADEQVRILVGEDAKATVFLTLSGKVEVLATVRANATLTVICLQNTESDIEQKAHLSTNATINWQNISLSPAMHRLVSTCEGPHACSNVDWVFYAHQNEQQTISARNVFDASHGGGEITMKGVAEDSAHVECNGLIDIGLQGGGTDTYLTEDVLMLDGSAKVDAVPGLEIKTNDVKASHSATVSKVTVEDLFYFASRGIDERTARQMYIVGFLQDRTQHIQDASVREIVSQAIEDKYSV